MRNLILALSVFLASTHALAGIVEADLATGRRWAETKADDETDGVQMNEAVFSARYNVMDTGLSVGPAFTYSKFRAADLGDDTTASNYELGLEAKYAHPVTESLIPYAKARYVAYSKGTIELDSDELGAELNFRTYGMHLGVGTAYAVTKQIQLTAELGYGVQMMRVTGGKIDHVTGDDGDAVALSESDKTLEGGRREDFNSKSLMLGVLVSL